MKIRTLADKLGIVNFNIFSQGIMDYTVGNFSPPINKNGGIPPLSTMEYCEAWVQAKNDATGSKINLSDFGLGYYEGRVDSPERKLSDSYKQGYSLGSKVRSETENNETNVLALSRLLEQYL